MPDSYLISVGVKADFSELNAEQKAAQQAVKSAADNMKAAYAELGVAAEQGSAQAIEALKIYETELSAAQERYELARASVERLGQAHAHTVPQVAAASAVIREFEGNLPIRAVERFLTTTLGMGPVLQAAFPVVGAIAFTGVAIEMGERLAQAFDIGGERARKTAEDIRGVSDSLRGTNDSLAVEIDRIEIANQKLEHKPLNGMKLVIDEAAEAADRLDQKLESVLKREEATIKGMGASFPQQALGLGSGTGYEQTMVSEHTRHLSEAKTEQDQLNESTSYGASLQTRLDDLKARQAVSDQLAINAAREGRPAVVANYTNEINAVQQLIAWHEQERRAIQQTIDLEKAQSTHQGLADSKANEGELSKANETRMRADEVAFNQLRSTHSLTLKEEADFWQQRISAYTSDTSQYEQITGRLVGIYEKSAEQAHVAIEKIKKEQKNIPNAPLDNGEIQKWNKEIADAALMGGDEWREYRAELLRTSLTQIEENARLAEAKVQLEVATGAISVQAAAHQNAAIHAQEYIDKLTVLRAELARINSDLGLSSKNKVDDSQKVSGQIGQVQGQQQVSAITDQTKEASLFEKPWVKTFNEIGTQWMKVQDRILKGQLSISRGAQQMASQMLLDVIHGYEQMLMNALRHDIMVNASHLASQSQQTAATAAGTSLRDGMEATSNLKSVFGAARAGAAKAYQAMAGIPIVGPELGAIAAAATFAGIMAYGGAFEKGGIVGGSIGSAVPITAHGGEAIIPQPLTSLLMEAAGSRGSGVRPGSFHSVNTFNGVADTKTFQKMLAKHERSVAAAVKKSFRNGRF
jgi:hypothetical protein